MEKPELRRQEEWVPLTKEQFRERFFERFYDPSFEILIDCYSEIFCC